MKEVTMFQCVQQHALRTPTSFHLGKSFQLGRCSKSSSSCWRSILSMNNTSQTYADRCRNLCQRYSLLLLESLAALSLHPQPHVSCQDNTLSQSRKPEGPSPSKPIADLVLSKHRCSFAAMWSTIIVKCLPCKYG